MKKTWYLMRHGQTVCNQQQQFYGSLDSPLTSLGVEQAQSLGKLLADYPIEQIVVSELSRSQETALLTFPKQSWLVEPRFNEKDFGLWEGKTANQIMEEFPEEWDKWLTNPLAWTPPEAESFQAFKDRVEIGLEALKALPLQHLALVGHLGVLRLIYQFLVDSDRSFWDITIPQGEVLVLEEQEGSWKMTYLQNQK